jgi:hypothetical protein
MAYGRIMLLPAAVDGVAAADRRKVTEQIRAFDLPDGAALMFPACAI